MGFSKVKGVGGLILKPNEKVHKTLLNLVYICHDLKGTCYLYVIKCPFDFSRVIYDGWRRKFDLLI